MKVQALDPETKHWLFATIIEVDDKNCKVSWTGYPKKYDCWLTKQLVREPVLNRALSSRKTIRKDKFPVRKDLKYLQLGDAIYDSGRKIKSRVATNDPFR